MSAPSSQRVLSLQPQEFQKPPITAGCKPSRSSRTDRNLTSAQKPDGYKLSTDPFIVEKVRDTKNRNFCTRNDIRLSGKRLGRPPKNPEICAAHKHQLSSDQIWRNEVEGCFGSGKRKYSLDLIMARLSKGVENSISMAFASL
jgi:hypothetical protein